MDKTTLKKENIIKPFDSGLESNIYLYKDENGNTVILKLFKDSFVIGSKNNIDKTIFNLKPETFELNEKILKNKERKLQILSKEPCMKDNLNLLKLVYDKDGKLIGYTTEKDTTVTFEDKYFKSRNEKIKYLKLLRKNIEEKNKNGIYLGDFNNPKNFGIRKNDEIVLFDVDSFYVKGLDFDFKNYFVKDYLKTNDKIDNVDNYCFNFFTLAYCERILMSYLMSTLNHEGLPHKFDTTENRKLLLNMIEKHNYKKGYFLDNMKKGLL